MEGSAARVRLPGRERRNGIQPGTAIMATIIEFRARPVRHDLMGLSLPSASADVVFFPGVRYERAETEAEAPQPPTRRSSRRDRLEFEED